MTLDSSSDRRDDRPHADSNPLLDSVDLWCPLCGGIVNVKCGLVEDFETQHEQCEDCRVLFTITHDGERFILTPNAPPDWREVEGDLRYHERN